MKKETQSYDLHYIGHVADKLRKMFGEYSETPNSHGYFLKFENYSDNALNLGVMVTTNCFENEAHFREIMTNKLILLLQEDNPRYSVFELDAIIKTMTRERLIKWLKWNDANGIYTDEESKREFGKVMSKNEAMRIMKRQILDR